MRRTRKADRELLEELEKERIRIETAKKERLEEFNRHTREANKAKAHSHHHKAAWGVDQRQFSSEEAHKQQAEIETLRRKRRNEREKGQEQGRTRIGLDLIPGLRYASSSSGKGSALGLPKANGKEIDVGVLAFMQEKRNKLHQAAKLRALIAQEQEEKRAQALTQLQVQPNTRKQPKRNRKKTKRKQSSAPSEKEATVSMYHKLRELLRTKAQQLRETEPVIQDQALSNAALALKMEELSEQLAHAKDLLEAKRRLLLEEEAVRRIQRCYRRYRKNRKVLQLSSVRVEDFDISLKSLGSFLGKKEVEKRKADSLDLLATEVALRVENEEAKAELVDHFRRSLALGYRQLASAPPAPSDSSPINTFRSVADSLNPAAEEVSLYWDPCPAPISPKPQAETGCSPSDSQEEPQSLRFPASGVDFMEDSARSLVECLGESPRPPASLRIPTGRRQALDLGRVVLTDLPGEVSEESPSIGSLIRGGQDSPEVLSFQEVAQDRRNLWRYFTSEHITALVEEVLEAEVYDLMELVAPMIGTLSYPEMSPTIGFVMTFLDALLAEMLPMEQEFMAKFMQPKEIDFAQELNLLSHSSICISLPTPIEKIIPDSIFHNACERLSAGYSPEDESYAWEQLCHLMPDVVNEALDVLRPESSQGKPPPWLPRPKDTRQFPDLTSVLCEVRDLMMIWSQAEMGKFEVEETSQALVREERVTTEIARDVSGRQIFLEDQSWVDYGREETQVRLMLADGVLEKLVEEALGCVAI